MSPSKGKGKAMAPAGSSEQDVAPKSGAASNKPKSGVNIVADLNDAEIWSPDDEKLTMAQNTSSESKRKNLVENPHDMDNKEDWITRIEIREDFDAEYSHYEEVWNKAGCPALLERKFGEIKKGCGLKQCISLGVGNFATKTLVPVGEMKLPGAKKPCGPNDVIRRLNSPLNQFMFFRKLAEFLGIADADVYFQEPGFTDFERSYLKSCFHEKCILEPYEGIPCPSGAQDQLTPETFLMAPMVSNHLSEVMQPDHKVPGLYVGTKMEWMISVGASYLKPKAEKAYLAPFNRYLARSSPQYLPRFVDKFTWPDQCEIRTLKPGK